MLSNRLFNRKFDARPDRIDFRDLLYRPRLVGLPDQYPSPKHIQTYFSTYRRAGMVLNQGQEGSCTGFGLAAVINYLRWERALNEPGARNKSSDRISARMLFQNARLYDEWKGDDYDWSSCRGGMKGFHKHGVCTEAFWPNFAADGKSPGVARSGWDEDAPLTPLGAYFRVDNRSLVDMQSAIFETHAIYVSSDVHDGWDRVPDKAKSLDAAVIGPQRKPELGGHAFAIVGYNSDGFIMQNSWGPDWGYQGFALLPYEEWTKYGYDAWALSLGAPMRVTIASGKRKAAQKKFRSPQALTEISLDERLRVRGPLLASAAKDLSSVKPWVDGEESSRLIVVGHGGRAERELVAAQNGDAAVRIVVEDGIRDAVANGFSKVAFYAHGGLNDRASGVKRAQILGPWFEANGIYPIFVIWQSGFFESAGDILKIAMDKLGVAPQRVEGWFLDRLKEAKDRGFEVFARDLGVKAIWENMKTRAEGASATGGGLTVAARSLKDVFASLGNEKPEIHLLGHSAGAIMHGHFLAALEAQQLAANSIHLWAPACTVDFATRTYGRAFSKSVANPKATYVQVLTDENELADACIPVLYSKSLLYLVSRALEVEYKTPLLGMQKAWTKLAKADTTFKEGYKTSLDAWALAGKHVVLDPPVKVNEVPTRQEKNDKDTIAADHGSFDNNIEVVNLALSRILGKQPKVPVTDLRGF